MWLAIWLALGAHALIWTLVWALYERRVPVATLVGAASWAILALRGSQVTHITDSGETVTTAVPGIQYLAVFMALISLLGLVMYHFGDFPPRQQTTDAQGA